MLFLSRKEINRASENYFGYDWTEICTRLKIPTESKIQRVNSLNLEDPRLLDHQALRKLVQEQDEAAGEPLRKEIDQCLAVLYSLNHDELNRDKLTGRAKEVLLECRAYIRKVSSNKIYFSAHHPVWKGMDKMKDDCEFLKIFSHMFLWIWD